MKENSIEDIIKEKYTRYLNFETDILDLTLEEAKFILETDERRNYVTSILQEAGKVILSDYKRVLKENEELKEYIATAPNSDEMTATKYRNIQQDAYIQGRAEEQQKAEQIIYENYIPIQKVKEILKNGEYRIIFEGDAEFPDEATIITTKYLKLEKVQKLQRENERLRKQNKIMCDEYCPQIQKIKAKIEELDIAILECEYSDDDSEEYKKEVEQDKLELLKQKRVLQELLEVRK